MKRVFIYSLAALMLIGCGKKTTTTTVEEERVDVRFPYPRTYKVI